MDLVTFGSLSVPASKTSATPGLNFKVTLGTGGSYFKREFFSRTSDDCFLLFRRKTTRSSC